MATHNQLARLHILLKDNNLMGNKADIIFSFSSGRSASSRDLTEAEADQLIAHLTATGSPARPTGEDKEKADKMKRKLISMAHQIGWKTAAGKIDMAAVNSWCCRYGYLKKPLDNHTYKELPTLLTQFEFGPYRAYLSRM